MVQCPVCDSDIDVEETDVDEGDTLSCDECGADLKVVGINPLEIASADEAAEDEEEEGFLDDDEEEEEEAEDEDWR